MRRRTVLSLLLAAGALVGGVPAAQAEPVCTRVTFEGGKLVPQDFESGQTCAGYGWGVYCQWHEVYSDDTSLMVDYCVPAIF
jgi:hypothetical protein